MAHPLFLSTGSSPLCISTGNLYQQVIAWCWYLVNNMFKQEKPSAASLVKKTIKAGWAYKVLSLRFLSLTVLVDRRVKTLGSGVTLTTTDMA